MDIRTKAFRAERLSNPLDEAVKLRDMSILEMVRAAVFHQEVTLAFQPIFGRKNPKQPSFYESLIRVLDETGRIIPAAQFLPFVQHGEIARELDRLALKLSLERLVKHPNLCLSVNMSARSIGYRPWMDTLNNALRVYPDINKRLILEISEGSVVEMPELVADFMPDLQNRGVSFCLDDYGSQHTSFKILYDRYFEFVKLDGSYTQRVHESQEKQILANTVATMLGRLGIHSVATKVESELEARMMRSLGFSYLQGFYFSAPTVSPPWDPVQPSPTMA
ncbi:EAL domain-containing protein [Cognatishimia sp. D5M38]|uniref:EAL domain-containing protein n=1 Tax=Cognatishimia coralii TaxID=3083254 RepID=A0ABU8QI18_9RHOB